MRTYCRGSEPVKLRCTPMGTQSAAKRKYELRKRADEMARTRLRITEAAVELHGTVGPARTTLSAVAERAGVQRHTVYRHFPSDEALFAACSGHYFQANPLPDLEPWRAISPPDQRLALALDELYAYYERTEPMFTNVLRDADAVAAVRPTLAPFEDYLAAATEILAAGRPARGRRRRVRDAALRHVVDFRTWQSLTTGNQLTRPEAIELASALVDAATAPRRRAAA